MWMTESFASVELLVAFLNDRGLTGDDFKLAVAHDAAGAEVFHLLYRLAPGGGATLVAVAEVESPALEESRADAVAGALDAAEAIIHDHDPRRETT